MGIFNFKTIRKDCPCESYANQEQQAYYNKLNDFVNMPKVETFVNSESYYGSLFHELVHSTGHSERLNRKELLEGKGFRSEDYAIEELTEMGYIEKIKTPAGWRLLERGDEYLKQLER